MENNEENIFRKLYRKSGMEFDYEVNDVFIDSEGETISQIINNGFNGKNYKILNHESYWDSIDINPGDNKETKKKFKANIFKRLVSKKKRRLQNELFDLDLSYITKRIIAMGFPSTGCESYWRNSLIDTKNFLSLYHKEVKIYNLCLEGKRIYPKDRFEEYKVGLFPFTDHDPCPIKLMLDFCVDVCLYFIKEPYGVAAIHCKAGKGRTGIMIICYLIFSGLCKNSDEAISYFAKMRTINSKGVTIASQIRYIKYFESFLTTNFQTPYVKMIPKMIKYNINPKTYNMIKNYIEDNSYLMCKNNFVLNYLKIGPFDTSKMLNSEIRSLLYRNLPFDTESKILFEDGKYYFHVIYKGELKINYDISFNIKGSGVKFYFWVNLWYSCLENITKYIYKNELFLNPMAKNVHKQEQFGKAMLNAKEDNMAPSLVEMKMIFNDFYNLDNENPYNKKYTILLDSKGNIFDVIDSIKHTMDMNQLIFQINNFAKNRNKEHFNKNDLSIILLANQLDKFSNWKKMSNEFKVEINYSLLDT